MKRLLALLLALCFLLGGCQLTDKSTRVELRSLAGESASAESTSAESAPEETEPETLYILNKSSMKFHRPDCQYAADIREENREESFCSRAELIEQGYSPCKKCRP